MLERIKVLSYSIRELVPLAKELEKRGKDVIYLNIGDPLKYDFKTPKHVIEALCKAAKKGFNYYSESEGLYELREAIAKKEHEINRVNIEATDVIVTQGVSEGINFLLAALIEENDEVFLPSPLYPLYANYVRFYGGKPKFYKLIRRENKWSTDISDIIDNLSKKTKAMVLINPNNPTGALIPEEELLKIIEIASENNLILISDEIYDQIVFEGKFRSLASLTKEIPVIGLNGFSKTFLVTGWRIGYIYFYDPEDVISDIKDSVLKMARNRLCTNTTVQKAMAYALKEGFSHLNDFLSKLKRRRELVIKILDETELITLEKPEAAFYAFPKIEVRGKWVSDEDFAKKLLKEKKVLVVPGSGFYMYEDGFFRIVTLPPEEVLEEALYRIIKFVETFSKN